MGWSTDWDVVCCPPFKNSSDRLFGNTVVVNQNHVDCMSDDEDLLDFVRVEVRGPNNDTAPSPSDFLSLPLTISPTSSSLPPTATSTDDYVNVCLQDVQWNHCIQDSGSTLENLPKKHYHWSKILVIGPKESPTYYFHILSIAIDYLNTFAKEKELGHSWKKVSVNKADGKNKIINILLALQKLDTNGVCYLDQGCVLSMLANMWDGRNNDNNTTMHHNNRVRIYRLVIPAMDVHCGLFQHPAVVLKIKQKDQ